MIKRITFILSLLVLSVMSAIADVVVLQSGQRVEGKVVVSNTDVVVIETPQGRRFQYLASDIKAVLISETAQEEAKPAQEPDNSGTRKVALRLMADGGICFLPNEHTGGTFGAEAAVGTSNLAGRRIFLGGSVGYAGMYMKGTTHFIPIQLVVSVPLLQTANTPEIGMSLGYGIGIKDKKNSFTGSTAGGLTGSLSIGYRWQMSGNKSLLLGLMTRLQQSSIVYAENINNETYSNDRGVCFITTAARFQVQF